MDTPDELGPRGGGFWQAVTSAYEVNVDEAEVLAECCRTLDVLDALRAAVEADGAVVDGSRGQTTLHPAIGEARQQRQLLGRLLGQLGLPHAEGEDERPALGSVTSIRARRAASVRWANRGA